MTALVKAGSLLFVSAGMDIYFKVMAKHVVSVNLEKTSTFY